MSGRADSQSLPFSPLSGAGSFAELCSAQPVFSTVLEEEDKEEEEGDCKAGGDDSKSTNVCYPCLCVCIYLNSLNQCWAVGGSTVIAR